MRKNAQSIPTNSAYETTAVTVDFKDCPEILKAIDEEVDAHESSRSAQVRVICREWAKERSGK